MMVLVRLIFLVLLLGAGTGPGVASAQPAGPPSAAGIDAVMQAFPDGLTSAQADALLAVMDGEQVRAALRDRLLGEIRDRAAAPRPASLLAFYAGRLDAVARSYPLIPAALADAFERPNGRDAAIRPLRLVASLALLFAAGTLVWAALSRLLPSAPGSVLRNVARDLLRIAGFIAGLLLAYAILRPTHPAAPAIFLAALQAALTVLVADLAFRLLCAPGRADLRLLPVEDGAAAAIRRSGVWVAVLSAALLGLFDLLNALGMAYDPLIALMLPVSTFPFLYLAVQLWSRRQAIAAIIGGYLDLDLRASRGIGTGLVLATVYLAGLWLTLAAAALRLEPGTGLRLLASFALAAAVPMAALLLHRPIARFHAAADAGDGDGSAITVRLMRAVWTALLVLAVVATALIWGFDAERQTGPFGLALRLLFDAGVVLLLGYVGWALLVRSFDRLIASQNDRDRRTAQRMATLLPLVRKFLQVSLVAVVVMIVLSSLGIAIGPLLAGAGVVGIAIGLGAQSTIADILSGIFFLLKDAFHIGDYVEVGQLRGTVENISLRSLKLRHHRGAIHTLPFGQIRALTNYTRDWALMRLEFRVPPETDLGLVKKLIKRIGAELSEDPEMGPSFIEPLKSQGVRRVEDDAVIIGVKYIAKPGEQFTIRREAYQRIIKAFNENGIDLVGRGVVVRVDDPNAASRAVGFAAVEAIRDPLGGRTQAKEQA
ncbi:mechanosensitive ion channel family protein [Skermanella sp. TT6]|uniref:Mechanosensitive ion channel family protein n=1 Tax=Skermanella cutis TaxID=2775420 RepID=A0ABX7BEW5_9PROT|nr:mechanosensitive ion channel family protein [Skermanella sp. TT6]QQP91606.1 mechanosensitive ion channel family protein [Skermanella sp. TT6]